MENQQYLGIALGPSLAGAFILMAAIIGAVVFFVKERNRRARCQESASSSASLFRGGRTLSNFRLPMFNFSPSPMNVKRDYPANHSTPQLARPWAVKNKVYTIPVTPSDSSKSSSIDSQRDRPYANITTHTTAINDTVTEKYYYNFDSKSTTTTNNNSNNNPNPSTTTTSNNNNNNHTSDNPNPSTTSTTNNNINTNDSNRSTATNTPVTSATPKETNICDQAVLRRSREVSHVATSKNETPIRSTIITEDAWNSTLDHIFNSALSVHEPGTHNVVNARETVYPS